MKHIRLRHILQRHSPLRRSTLALAALALTAHCALADTCKKDDFATAVDQAGASLRKFNLENQPRLNAKLEALRAKKGWKKTDSEDKAMEYLQDGRIAELDGQSNELLTKIDSLGRQAEGPVDCGKLGELKAAGVELLAVMKAKSTYTLEKIELEIAGGGAAVAAAKPIAPAPAPPKVEAPKAETAKNEPPKAEAKSDPAPAAEAKGADSKIADVKIISKPVEPKAAEPRRDEPKRDVPKVVEVERIPPPAAPQVKPLTERERAEARVEVDRQGP